MLQRPVLRLFGLGLLAACCFTHAAYAQEGADAQTQALVRRLQEGARRSRLSAA